MTWNAKLSAEKLYTRHSPRVNEGDILARQGLALV